MKVNSLTLIPIRGKFASVDIGKKTVEVYRLDPVTGKDGTAIPYKEAIAALCVQPAQVSCIEGADMISAYDRQMISQSKTTGMSQFRDETKGSGDNGVDANVLGSYEKLLAEQKELLMAASAQIESLKAQLEVVKGESGDTADKDEAADEAVSEDTEEIEEVSADDKAESPNVTAKKKRS